MITDHPSFRAPQSKTISIWRYMDLSKFLWMLQNSALYFSRADLLGDPYEGHYTEPMAGRIPEPIRNMVTIMKKTAYVNCWHMNEAESAAMWKLYTSHHQSVAVKSSYDLISETLPSECFIGCVEYIDYSRAVISVDNAYNYLNRKRLSFAHERELRVVVWDPQILNRVLKSEGVVDVPMDSGRVFPIDISNVITEVYLSPDSDNLLFDVVERECRKYGILAPVLKSGVNAPPAY
jgi:hypothetical protein